MRQALAILLAAIPLYAQTAIQAELKAEPNASRRVEKSLALAEQSFATADDSYNKGDVHKGDAELDDMMTALRICLDSLDAAHKGGLWKKAELRVALLQRKLNGLLDNIGVEQRGWAEYTGRKLDEVHDKMLEGVMQR